MLSRNRSRSLHRLTLKSNQGVSLLMLLALSSIAVAQQPTAPTSETTGDHGTRIITQQMVGPYQPRSRANVNDTAELIIKRTNIFRKSQDLEPVETNETLQKAAREFAQFMAREDKYGHQANGQTPAQRAEDAGYEICRVAENIAMQFRSTGYSTGALGKLFVEGWKKSPGHRKNMLTEDVTQTGVAIAQSSRTGVYYAVQLFGRPRDQAIEFTMTNGTDDVRAYRINDQAFELAPRQYRTHWYCTSVSVELIPADATESKPEALASVTPADGDRITIERKDSDLKFETESNAADDGPFPEDAAPEASE